MVLARRQLLVGGAGLAALSVAGCGTAASPPQALPAMLVHRDPGCGCCTAWADQARAAGYPVTVRDTAAMAAVKQRLMVPADLASCHTVEVDGLAVEGHVPLATLARLRIERLPGVIGLAVPGMPRGSPGMEMPDGTADRFVVYAFRADGSRAVYDQV